MKVVTVKNGNASRAYRISMEMILRSIRGITPFTRDLREDDKVYLHCERPESQKQHNLGDQWAVDRQRTSFYGEMYQQFHLDDQDLDLLHRAIARGCR